MNTKRLLNVSIRIVQVFVIVYSLVILGAFIFQEKIIFHPDVLPKSYEFESSLVFEELDIEVEDGVIINTLLFKSPTPSKGLIFYLHGNVNCLKSWSRVAPYSATFGYDVCILDYRGFGKSTGKIESEEQFYTDIQKVYDKMVLSYHENDIIVLGYSIGTAAATKIAKENNPKQLILQAPYISLVDIMNQRLSFLPSFILKYEFKTEEFLSGV